MLAARKFSLFDGKRVNNNHHSQSLFHRIRWQNDGSLLKLEYYSHLLCILSVVVAAAVAIALHTHYTIYNNVLFVRCLLLLTFGFALMMLFTWADFVPNRLFIRLLCFLREFYSLTFSWLLIFFSLFIPSLSNIKWAAAHIVDLFFLSLSFLWKNSCTYVQRR